MFQKFQTGCFMSVSFGFLEVFGEAWFNDQIKRKDSLNHITKIFNDVRERLGKFRDRVGILEKMRENYQKRGKCLDLSEYNLNNRLPTWFSEYFQHLEELSASSFSRLSFKEVVLPNLKKLTLDELPLEDLSDRQFPELEELEVSFPSDATLEDLPQIPSRVETLSFIDSEICFDEIFKRYPYLREVCVFNDQLENPNSGLEGLQKKLKFWVQSAPKDHNLARKEAAKRMEHCFKNKEKQLSLSNLSIFSLPPFFEDYFGNLEELSLSNTKVEKLELKLPWLKRLYLEGFLGKSLKGLKAPRLENLNLSASKIKELKGDFLKNLVKIELFACTSIKDIDLTKASKLQRFSGELSSLEKLEISGALALENVELAYTKSLQELSLRGDFKNLKCLDLRRSNLGILDDSWLQLPSHLKVFCPMDWGEEKIFEWKIKSHRLRLLSDGKKGPMIFTRVQKGFLLEELLMHPLFEELIKCSSDKEVRSEFFWNLLRLEEPKRGLLQRFLSSLQGQPEARGKHKGLFMDRVYAVLYAMAISKGFREIAFDVIDEAMRSCEDRIGFGFARLEMFYLVEFHHKDSDLPTLGKFLIGCERQYLLEGIAREKVQGQNEEESDPIEVFLYYMIHLKKPLGLPFSKEEMIFSNLAKVSEDDLKKAKQSILEKTSSLEDRREVLMRSEVWIKRLEKVYSPKFVKLKKRFDDLLAMVEENYPKEKEEDGSLKPVGEQEKIDAMCQVAKKREEFLQNLIKRTTQGVLK